MANRRHPGAIPESVFEKPPSAELRPNQKDSDSLPDYDTLDRILRAYVEDYQPPQQIADELRLPIELVRDIVNKVDRNEYKRQQAAPGLKVTTKAFGIGQTVSYRAEVLRMILRRRQKAKVIRWASPSLNRKPRSVLMTFAFCLLLFAFCLFLVFSAPAPHEQVGPLPGGGFLLNSGWRVQPAGKQLPLDTFPMLTALSPDGRYLLVLNGGYKPPSISVIDLATTKEIGRTAVSDGWLGLAFSPKGDKVYVGGGARASVFEFAFSQGKLQPARTFVVVEEAKRAAADFIGDVVPAPDGHLLYAASLYRDSIVVINALSGIVIDQFRTGRRPYRILFHPDGKSFFVTSWTDGTLYQHQTDNGALLAKVQLGPHLTDMIWRAGKPQGEEDRQVPWDARLFVAAANTNSVYAVGVSASGELSRTEAINVATTPVHPSGMTPSALALNKDGSRLFVVCSDANAVAVADVTEARSRVMGFVPVGWYPTAARSLPDGRLVVLNGRGDRSYPNPQGPNPTKRAVPLHLGGVSPEYVGRMQTGTASFIDPFDDDALAAYTHSVRSNSPYRDSLLEDAGVPQGNPVPSFPGGPTPVEHVIYIVKENRTYDQVLGDVKTGNGDPSLVLFGENVTPNLHKLAREFVLLDNFYVNSDVSADGHNWSTAAIAPDYVQKLWPNSYGGRRKLYDYEGSDPTAAPPSGYLWTSAASAGLSIRNYGYFVTNLAKADASGTQVGSGARSDPQPGHQPALSRVRSELSRCRTGQGLSRRPGGIREDRPDAAPDLHASGQRSHFRHGARQDCAALGGRRQRLRAGDAGGGRVEDRILGENRDLRARRRRAEWAGPRGFAPLPGLRHLALREAPLGGQLDVQHHVDAAHHGADPWAAAHDALRRRRAPHVRALPGRRGCDAVYARKATRVSR